MSPIVLGKHEIIEKLVRETHEKNGHAGTQIVMNILRERYWILSSRKIIKDIISKCIICKRHRAKRLECKTPPLPLNRVRDALVFEVVGVDFAGPLYLKGGGKGVACLFTYAVSYHEEDDLEQLF